MQKVKPEKQLNWYGEFRVRSEELQFRKETWPGLTDRIGKIALLSAVFFLMAGISPFFLIEAKSTALHLVFLRGIVSLFGIIIYLSTFREKPEKYLIMFIAVYIFFIGFYESYEAVLTYRPGVEYSIPFTLLIILLTYLLFPLAIKAVAPASLLASSVYLVSLGIVSTATWADMIQLSVFFLFSNIIGIYIFILLSRNRRYRYLSYNEIKKLYAMLDDEIRKKEKANRQLAVLADTDELTGIANRRKFFSRIEKEFSKAKRYKRPLSLMMMDIDYFKNVNDTYGHDAGDLVIVEFTERCLKKLRRSDMLARIGGEEFAIILPETSGDGAFKLAERIRKSICTKDFNVKGKMVSISTSSGVVSLENGEFADVNGLVKYADNALYRAKNSGRNRSCRCSEEDVQ